MVNWRYTEEHLDYLRVIAPGRMSREITEMFNKKFNLNKSRTQIKNTMGYHKIKSNTVGKGKKGQIAYNRDKVGTVRLQKWNAVIKIADPDVWQDFSRYLYEQYNEKLKDGEVVMFLDQNKRNFNINNLIKVTKQDVRTINAQIGLSENAEINKSVVALAKLQNKIYEKKKEI